MVNPQGIEVGVIRSIAQEGGVHRRAHPAVKDRNVFLIASAEGGDVKEVYEVCIRRSTVYPPISAWPLPLTYHHHR